MNMIKARIKRRSGTSQQSRHFHGRNRITRNLVSGSGPPPLVPGTDSSDEEGELVFTQLRSMNHANPTTSRRTRATRVRPASPHPIKIPSMKHSFQNLDLRETLPEVESSDSEPEYFNGIGRINEETYKSESGSLASAEEEDSTETSELSETSVKEDIKDVLMHNLLDMENSFLLDVRAEITKIQEMGEWSKVFQDQPFMRLFVEELYKLEK